MFERGYRPECRTMIKIEKRAALSGVVDFAVMTAFTLLCGLIAYAIAIS